MDSSILLCERCGYNLGGLPGTGACPECGLAISESVPERRTGSAWQRRPSLSSWCRTNAGTLRRPRETFRRGIVEQRRSILLLIANCLFTGLLVALPWTGTILNDPSRGESGVRGGALFVVMLGAWSALAGAVLLTLTLIEHAGVRFFAARRGWRLSIRAAWQVCGHASVGWALAPVAAFVSLVVLTTLARFFGVGPNGVFRLRLGATLEIGPIGWADLTYAVILIGSAAAGLVAFEVLVYIGVRECRFANAPPAELARHGRSREAPSRPREDIPHR